MAENDTGPARAASTDATMSLLIVDDDKPFL
jgi:hypothetical protein